MVRLPSRSTPTYTLFPYSTLFRSRVEQIAEQFAGGDRVGVERVERRRLDADGAPVGAKLVGDDLRQRRIHALAVLGLRHGDHDMPVLADLAPRAHDMLAARRRQVGRIGARSEEHTSELQSPMRIS